MKRTPALPVLIIISMFFITAVYGQNNDEKKPEYKKTPQEQATKIVDKLNSKLNLSSEQYKKVYDAYVDRISKEREIRTESMKLRGKMKDLNKDFGTKMKSTLNDDQQKTFKKMEKKKKKMAKRHKRRNF